MSAMKNQEAEERINRQLGELPTSLEVVCRLMMMLRNPTQENEQVVEVLLTDKDLTMQLVTRLAMKDKEKLKQGEDSMDSKTEAEILKILFDAVLHMGYRAILSLVSALSVGQILSSEFRGYGYGKRELWLHSVTTALATQRFCEVLQDSNRAMHDPSLGFIAGVMHDIGKAGLNTDLGQDPQTVSSTMGKAKGTWVKLEKDLCVSTTLPWEPFW